MVFELQVGFDVNLDTLYVSFNFGRRKSVPCLFSERLISSVFKTSEGVFVSHLGRPSWKFYICFRSVTNIRGDFVERVRCSKLWT